jgi:GDP-L-fucose synthase
MNKDTRIFLAGHRGMVGSAIHRRLRQEGFSRVLTRSRAELDLTDQHAVRHFFRDNALDCVVLAAARVGGIQANNAFPAEFIHQNLAIQTNVIHAAHTAGVDRLLFLGSSCIYPKLAEQPMREEALLGGRLEPTNEPYAIAKIAGIKLCESYNRQYGRDYRSVMPTNLYGPGDNFDLTTSHVLPALIRKFHLAKLAETGDTAAVEKDESGFGPIPEDVRSALAAIAAANGREGFSDPQPTNHHPPGDSKAAVRLWGRGTPRREFLHVDDLADACVFLTRLSDGRFDALLAGRTEPGGARYHKTPMPLINIGAGKDATVAELAAKVAEVVGYEGPIVWDSGKPDGTPRKLLDVSRMAALGWRAKVSLGEGLHSTYDWYRRQLKRR